MNHPNYDRMPPQLRARFAPVEETAEMKAARYTRAIQNHLDAAAQARGYDSILSATTYRGSVISQFDAEGVAFAQWRDETWAAAAQMFAAVQAGQAELPPDEAAVLALLPPAPTFG